MFKLRDFLHIPELNTLFEQWLTSGTGLTIIAGIDPHPSAMFGRGAFLPSGRSTMLNVFIQEYLASAPGAKAVVLGKDKSLSKPIRSFRKRYTFHHVEHQLDYETSVEDTVQKKPNLLVIDQLTDESLLPALDGAQRGVKVITQMDTVLRGADLIRQLGDMGASAESLSNLAWIFYLQRFPKLCLNCKQVDHLDAARLEHLCIRYPDLSARLLDCSNEAQTGSDDYFRADGCEKCHHTGRFGDITVFDVFHSSPSDVPLHLQPSVLSLEEYILHLGRKGHLPIDDLLHLDADQLRRTYYLLGFNEKVISDAHRQLNQKLVELESANRVLVDRTKVMITLQELSKTLITTLDLEELADKVCQSAQNLCGADRTVLYTLRLSEESRTYSAEILGMKGWRLISPPRDFSPEILLSLSKSTEPSPYTTLPPGIEVGILHPEDQEISFQAGLLAPLITQDQRVGLMIVQSAQKKEFTPGEVALLKAFANQAALAVQRASLVDELRVKFDQLKAAQVEVVKKERLERELELARQVQQSVLPKTFPDIPGYMFAAKNEPARQVGGDFYDVIDLDSDHFGLVIGDVSDKGMPAALFMALTRSLILAEAHRDLSPRSVLSSVNHLLLELGEPTKFVTVFYGIIHRPSRRLIYSRAGHDRPLILRHDQILSLGGSGTALGILEDEELVLTEGMFSLEPGDKIVLYTDGLPDVLNIEGQFFGLERLESLLSEYAHLPPSDLCAAVFQHLSDYQAGEEQFDDMTLLIASLTQQ